MHLTFALSLPHVGKHRGSSGAMNLGGSAWGRGALSTNRDARRSLLMCLETSMQPVSVAIEVRLCFPAPGRGSGTDRRSGCQGRSASCPKRPEEIKEEDDFLAAELKLFRSVGGPVQLPCYGQVGPLVLSEKLMRKMASPRARNPQIKHPRMACRYPWAEVDSKIEVFGDGYVAGCISTRKSTVGGVALWSGHFVNA